MNQKPLSFRSNGKLLITGEYLVLDGARALAVPTQLGQSLTIKPNSKGILHWKSYDNNGKVWFRTDLKTAPNGVIKPLEKNDIANRLAKMLNAARSLNPDFLGESHGYDIKTYLEFPRDWGLGSSSTLINNLSQWAKIDPYNLLKLTFGGSGYDIACASNDKSITYKLLGGDKRTISKVDFKPKFSEYIYFAYLNKKQNSRDGIALYQASPVDISEHLKTITEITINLINSESLSQFQKLINLHEALISKIIGLKPVKERLFPDFNGSIKSLGAWGGDFIMVASENVPTAYFHDKGYETVIAYRDMVLG